jgi:preprotein translocase subunit YajC
MIAFALVGLGLICAAGLAFLLRALLRRRARRALWAAVDRGDDVVTVGGLAGRVVKIDGDWLLLALGRGRSAATATVLLSAVEGRWPPPEKDPRRRGAPSELADNGPRHWMVDGE